MPLQPGTRLGPYEIVAPIGSGGMGEVYRARDTRLHRDVAIKALPAEFARDPERLARFEREAKLLASLTHPNIAVIHGLEVIDDHRYLVLELVEGETLADRLVRGPLPVPEAVEVCAAVAAALESAHESGVVHRDLKPGNVMLTPQGAVKVLDFGLAKGGGGGAGVDPGLSASPTMTYGYIGTQAGVVLGTAAYMSPEQARGKAVDKRSDIWSFGCVLFECLTGRQAFAGETVSDLIAHILTSEPDWAALPAATPPRVRELLRRCLEKDVRRRLRDIGDARIELEDVLSPRGTASSAAVSASIAGAIDAQAAAAKTVKKSPSAKFQVFVAIVGAVIGVLATRVVGGFLGDAHVATRGPARFEVVSPPGIRMATEGANVAISPGGTRIVYQAGDSTTNKLWVRPVESLTARPLDGTDNAILPFWSPDGKWLAFFTATKLCRVSATGGDVDEIADVKRARGGDWNRQGQILFAPTSEGPLWVVPATGGEPRQVTVVDSAHGETGQRAPQFLPDGKHFLYTSLPPRDGRYRIMVGSLDGAKPESLMAAPGGVHYAEPGYLLYTVRNALTAVRFDAAKRRIRGQPIVLRDLVFPTNMAGLPGFSVSQTGRIVFPTFLLTRSRLDWFELLGKRIGPSSLEPAQYVGTVTLSPDDRHVAVDRAEGTELPRVWVGDLERGVMSRFSTEDELSAGGKWSPDGKRIAYAVSTVGPQSFVVRPFESPGPVERYLDDDPSFKDLVGWTPDGKFLIFNRQASATRWDIYLQPLSPGAKAQPYLQTAASEQAQGVSKDGRWMAYTSDESGQTELYVQSFPQPGSKYQVTNGGTGAYGAGFWTADGKTLGYTLAKAGFTMMAADIVPGPTFRLAPNTRVLLRIPEDGRGGDIAHDGKRLLLLVPEGKEADQTLTVVLDWTEGLRAK